MVIPLIRSAIITGLIYSFVRAMTAVSQVIFLVSPGHDLVTVLILSWVGYGTTGRGAALSTLLIVVLAACILPAQVGPSANRRCGSGRMSRPAKENGMAHFGVCAWIYGDAPLEQTLARIASDGYDGVEIPGEPCAFDPASVRRALANSGLVPVGLTASCMVPATRRDLAHPDPAIRTDAVGYLVACLRFAAEIGPTTSASSSSLSVTRRMACCSRACQAAGIWPASARPATS